jgi:thiamine transport system permease protein
VPILFLGIFYFLPVYRILLVSLSADFISTSGINVPRILRVIGFTLYQASLSAGITLLVGTPIAYLLHLYNFKLKNKLFLLTAIPFMLPTVVVATGFNSLLGPNGVVNLLNSAISQSPKPLIGFMGTIWAIVAAHVFYNATIVIRMVKNTLDKLDPSLVDSAKMLGASPIRAFINVTLPRLAPSLLVSGFLVFFFDFTSFGVILMLGGPKFATLEVEIFTQTMHYLNLPFAAILSIIQIFFTITFSIIYSRSLANGEENKTSKISWEVGKTPRSFGEKSVVALLTVFVVVLFLAPIIALPIRSFTVFESLRTMETFQIEKFFTFNHYVDLFTNSRNSYFYVPPFEALKNSLLFAVSTILLSLAIGLPSAFILSKNKTIRTWLEPLFILPLGTSSVTLGLGYILFFNRSIFPGGENLLTSPWLLPFAHTTIALPFVIRNLFTAIQQIPTNYHESAKTLGASPVQTILNIDLPILNRALVSSAAFAFTISLGEFGATSLLSRPDFPTLPTAIYRFISQPGAANFGQAMAMSTILFVLCGLGIAIIEKTQTNYK